jgi:hypothetical protein
MAGKKPHQITVAAISQHRTKKSIIVPMIRLRGQWLEEAGFATGETVVVTIGDNEIKLTRVATSTKPATRVQGTLF